MNAIGSLWLLFFLSGALINGYCSNVTSRPDIVNVGAIFTFASTIGRVAKVAIQEAVKDVNSDPNVLRRTKLNVIMRNSNCSGFAGMIEALRFMETDIVAIIGPQSTVVAHVISHVANELHVPLMSFAATGPALSPLQFPFFVRTTHSDLYQMTAIAEIIGHYGWKEVIAIFVDDDYGRNGVSVLNDKLAERRCKISYKGGIHPGSITRGDIMDLLVKVAVMQSRVIVVHVNPDIGYKVFSVAQYLGMMGDGFVWIATDWLSAVLDSAVRLPSEIMDTMQGVLVLRQHTPDSKRRKSFFSRWKKINNGSLGLNAYGLYAYDSVWLVAHAIEAFFSEGGVISFSNDYRLLSAEGGNLHLEAMSIFDYGDLLLRNILQSNFVGLTGPFKFNLDRSLFRPAYDIINVVGTGHRQIGYWSNYSGLSTTLPEILYTMPPNRSTASQQLYAVIWPGGTLSIPRGWVFPNNGKQLRVGVPRRVSFQEFVSQERRTGNFQGFCIDVFIAALNLVPYAVPYIFIPFGNGTKNPSYSEFMDLITTGSFDVAVGDIAIVANRTKIVDFTQPYVSSGLVVVAPIEKLHTVAWAFLQPLSREMWIVTGCFCLFVGIVMWILEHRINNDFRGSPKKQIVTILWFCLSTLFFSHREKPASYLGRMVLLIWLFVVLIVNYSYTASLTSILTVQQLASPIKGIESLQNGDEPIGYQVGSFAERYLSEELNISKSRLKPLASQEEYASALQLGPNKGGVAAIVDERPYAELFLSSQCSFRIVGQEFTKNGWGFAFTRNSPLAIDMSAAILQLSENGELQRIHDKWFKQSSCILENAGIESGQLHLQSFIGLFLICGIACFIALLIYFLQTMRRFARDSPTESSSTPHQGGATPSSGRFRKILSLMDEKKEHSSHGRSKRRRMEKSLSENDQETEFSIAPGMDKRK